ncbi:MAG: 5'/3'-nucleotidase SurE [Candidatus Fibromonas sp.]|jgi:5'-nucleotidase|nr:5'/3'-nucleotidase SurE [Candidatus Fibromonas sp.]
MDILITNDDGITASNLLALAKAAMECANVRVVAPQREQSGVGHGFSYYRSLHFAPAKDFPCEAFWVDGTPADCMKFALKHIYKDFKFDLVISGVNNGDNAGVASFYSGTVGAAREAALWGVPAIAVSLQKQSDYALDYALKWVQKILREKSFAEMPRQSLWNFNVPPCSKENPCKGVKVSTTSTSMFSDYYVEAEQSKNYLGEETTYLVNEDSTHNSQLKNSQSDALKAYNLVGSKIPDLREGTDDWWLNQGYASLSPQSVDLTDAQEYKRLSSLYVGVS